MTGYVVLGCGQRAVNLVRMLASFDSVRLVAAWDRDPAQAARVWQTAGREGPPPPLKDWSDALDVPGCDWVLVSSVNADHFAHLSAALERGKHVFAEKPLVLNLPDGIALATAAQKAGTRFMTGLPLRYSPLYRQVKQVIDRGTLGKVISIDANENLFPGHGAYIFTNWRRDAALAGSHVLEKSVHDLDLLGWFTGSVPRRVAAFGGNAMFVPENAALFEKTRAFLAWEATGRTGLNPFTSDKSVEDTLVSILDYQNGAKVQFQLTSSNPLGERRMYLSGTEGTLIVDLVTETVRWKTLYDDAETVWTVKDAGFHGGGDEVMIAELVDSMVNGSAPVCGLNEGLQSTLVGIALDQTRREGRVLDLSEWWGRLP